MDSLPAILLAHVFYNSSVIIRIVGAPGGRLGPQTDAGGTNVGANGWASFGR